MTRTKMTMTKPDSRVYPGDPIVPTHVRYLLNFPGYAIGNRMAHDGTGRNEGHPAFQYRPILKRQGNFCVLLWPTGRMLVRSAHRRQGKTSLPDRESGDNWRSGSSVVPGYSPALIWLINRRDLLHRLKPVSIHRVLLCNSAQGK
jgi:hypothetical protein